MAVSNFRYKVPTTPVGYSPEIAEWCRQNIGTYGIMWGRIRYTWRFRFKRDAVLFTLRWA
jgi:hypothetical protein